MLRGRASTILTGPGGVLGQPNLGTATLTGGMGGPAPLTARR